MRKDRSPVNGQNGHEVSEAYIRQGELLGRLGYLFEDLSETPIARMGTISGHRGTQFRCLVRRTPQALRYFGIVLIQSGHD
mmetsp:Transcript_21895/g.89078  ORF Transcript_21895/g.89078 Transcript_21895/m.89078 type:complete len:81 (+) Transcript_21895:416-658(+)